MTAKQYRCAHALTLVEVMVAISILCIATLGAFSYQYHAVKQSLLGRAQITAIHTGYLVLEDWKANGGSDAYVTGIAGAQSPADMGMGFVYVGEGVYKVTVDTLPMYVELSRPSENLALIPLTVIISWPANSTVDAARLVNPSIVLNTYARADQSSG